MPSLTFIKGHNIFKQSLLSLLSGLKAQMMNPLGFQGMKEAFRKLVIPTVAFTTHSLMNAGLL
jgi:hypothetical protein